MKRDTTKKYYQTHSWMGVITAILMFVICFTGAFSVFGRPELKLWSHSEIVQTKTIDPVLLEQVVRNQAKEVDKKYWHEIQVSMPAVSRAEYLQVFFMAELSAEEINRGIPPVKRFDFHPETLELVDQKQGTFQEIFQAERIDMADFIIKFHADLYLGDPWGLMLTGLLGLTLVASIITGVIVHRKILREAFSFRPFRSIRLLLTDGHKIMGVWGMLFHATIGFTGAFLGLAVVVLLPAAAYVSFNGDQGQLIESFLPEPEPVLTGQQSDIHLAQVVEAVRNRKDGDILNFEIKGAGDAGAIMLVNVTADKKMIGSTLQYRAKDAEFQNQTTAFSKTQGATGPILDVMFPLHYGNFGGLPIKFLWAVLGFSTAFLALSGMLIWIERRTFGSTGDLSLVTYHRIAKFTVGSCFGLVLACVSLFYAQLFLSVPATDSAFWIGTVFFGSWLLALVWAIIRSNAYRSTKEILAVAAVAMILVPFINGMVTGNHLFNVFTGLHYVAAGVDFVLLTLGLLLLRLAYKLPTQRPNESHRNDKRRVRHLPTAGAAMESAK